ncbi:MAG: aldo/keto reductase [Acidimicrobiales bacterium]
MRTRVLGRTGLEVSVFGLGAMVLGSWGNRDRDACVRIINRALDAGINLVDTADMYADGENEQIVGEAINDRRDEVVLATKFHYPIDGVAGSGGNSRSWIMCAVEDSLRRLDTDCIDLYQVHRPDPDTPIEETVGALDELVQQGKIRHWGTSTFPAEDLVEAQWAADRLGATKPGAEQPPYSILCRGIEADVLPTCIRHDIGVLTWSPLAGGWLTGKHRRGQSAAVDSRASTNPDHFDSDNPLKYDAVEALEIVAREAGLSLTHMSMAWNVEHPGVTAALIGPRTEQQLEDLLGAADVELTPDILDRIDRIVVPGLDLNPTDVGWTPPGLGVQHRRRPT